MVWRAALAFALGLGQTAAAMDTTFTPIEFAQLSGWEADDHAAALTVFWETCTDLEDPEWQRLCAVASQSPNPKKFFEAFFQPVLIEDGAPMVFTGYYEPELRGARDQSEAYPHPLYALPPEVSPGTTFLTRRQIEEGQTLAGRELELVWIDDPVDVFFLQVQGSGRVALADGSRMRVGYAGKNGHTYRSIGAELIRRGTFEAHEVSAQVIRNWVKSNPKDGQQLLWHNDSFVFFREVSDVPADRGPLGAMNRSITDLRSIAVDPAFTPLGAPVWIEKSGQNPMSRLMVAQDTGSAIKGAQRADIFFGTGDAAGLAAGRIKDDGRMVTLLPIQIAHDLIKGQKR